jgi:BMFP domain-containing protein YqiC
MPWSLERLKEFEDLLRRVKELEDRLGCPCEPKEADYLALLRQRIEQLEKKAAEKPND